MIWINICKKWRTIPESVTKTKLKKIVLPEINLTYKPATHCLFSGFNSMTTAISAEMFTF